MVRTSALRRLARIAIGSALLVAVALVAAVAMAVEDRAAVQTGRALGPGDVERVLNLLRRHDPRHQRAGIVRALVLEESDIEVLLMHAGARVSGVGATLQMQTDRAELRLSAPAPWSGGRRWLNMTLELASGDGAPKVLRWQVGALPLPAWAAWPWARLALARRAALPDADALLHVVTRVDFRPGRLTVFYAWHPDSADRLMSAVLPPAEQARLRAYVDRLNELSAEPARREAASLAQFIAPLFQLARQRSSDDEQAVAENRAALLALTLYANRVPPNLPSNPASARSWLRPVTLTLAGREDLPLHYLVSATLAAESGRPLADAVGVYKELADSRGGSGFSFVDMMADRAGTRLGVLALQDGRGLQQRMAAVRDEAELLPPLRDLPESLSAATLQQRFGGPGGPAYGRLVDEIDARLSLTPTLR